MQLKVIHVQNTNVKILKVCVIIKEIRINNLNCVILDFSIF